MFIEMIWPMDDKSRSIREEPINRVSREVREYRRCNGRDIQAVRDVVRRLKAILSIRTSRTKSYLKQAGQRHADKNIDSIV